MTQFEVHGPYTVSTSTGSAGRRIRKLEGRSLFARHPAMTERRGCYVFAIRAGRGMTPIYVGKTTKGFAQECFTPHKLEKYIQCLSDYKRGTPVLFFITFPKRQGRQNDNHLGDLERFLIQTGVAENPELLNVQNTKAADWNIIGVLRSRAGKPSISAQAFRRAMSLN